MIVVDTGVLVALLDADDQHHQHCRGWYANAEGPLIVPTPVMVETCYVIERDSNAETEANFLLSFDDGDETTSDEDDRLFVLAQLEASGRTRMAELVKQYADFPLGAVDASVIALAERLMVNEVATIDHRHFRTIRPKHVNAFTIVP